MNALGAPFPDLVFWLFPMTLLLPLPPRRPILPSAAPRCHDKLPFLPLHTPFSSYLFPIILRLFSLISVYNGCRVSSPSSSLIPLLLSFLTARPPTLIGFHPRPLDLFLLPTPFVGRSIKDRVPNEKHYWASCVGTFCCVSFPIPPMDQAPPSGPPMASLFPMVFI